LAIDDLDRRSLGEGGYLIRRAEPADIATLPSIERRAACMFEAWLTETGLTLDRLEDVSDIEELDEARRRGHLWVATTAGGDIVGFAQVVILDGTAHLDEVDVVPEHGRKGVGTRLLTTVCEWARDNGYSNVTLTTFRDVPWNRAFYEERGFHVVDPRSAGPEHQEQIASQAARGFRADLRVLMTCELAG
jgi:GNAT superfamily N-acetyltransferase